MCPKKCDELETHSIPAPHSIPPSAASRRHLNSFPVRRRPISPLSPFQFNDPIPSQFTPISFQPPHCGSTPHSQKLKSTGRSMFIPLYINIIPDIMNIKGMAFCQFRRICRDMICPKRLTINMSGSVPNPKDMR